MVVCLTAEILWPGANAAAVTTVPLAAKNGAVYFCVVSLIATLFAGKEPSVVYQICKPGAVLVQLIVTMLAAWLMLTMSQRCVRRPGFFIFKDVRRAYTPEFARIQSFADSPTRPRANTWPNGWMFSW